MSLRDEWQEGAEGHGLAAPFGLVFCLQCWSAFPLVGVKRFGTARHVLNGEGDATLGLALHMAQTEVPEMACGQDIGNVFFHHVLDPIVGAFFSDADGDVVENHAVVRWG